MVEGLKPNGWVKAKPPYSARHPGLLRVNHSNRYLIKHELLLETADTKPPKLVVQSGPPTGNLHPQTLHNAINFT